ncbi:MAG: manganese efflux pump MntP family protein [Clostridia bacterium]|nr:manganese efflux pump MntP family protein [Clostridia bacterium]
MSLLEIILVGVALAMDAFALTIANCTTYKNSLTRAREWSMPIAFAVFQFLMPVIGFYIGSIFSKYLEKVSVFITAGIFFLLAIKIVLDNIKEMSQNEEVKQSEFSFGILILQGIATSIDALAIGITFAVTLNNPFIASLIIGLTTFIIVAVALYIGKSLGTLLGKYAQWAGAIILFCLAIKNLISGLI